MQNKPIESLELLQLPIKPAWEHEDLKQAIKQIDYNS